MNAIMLRNGINHIILNWIMLLRYRLRRQPRLVGMLLALEAACVRTGIIFYGSGRERLQGKASRV